MNRRAAGARNEPPDSKRASNEKIPTRGVLALAMTPIHCAQCGALVEIVRDTRFGAAPASALCLACSHPAFAAWGLRR